ncbi:MFS transporter [Corynebacterium cystitidis]|uniref:MFS transporter n=1 Tax=Corynebacterium cystitidis TaxID=35757 RepID=UPI00211DF485|nr:MFS transporter [Corynebacterium cystitidis]
MERYTSRLTIGYAVFITAFIRVGEKLLQKFGAKKPMLWGAIIVIISIAMLLFTDTMASTYAVLVAISYCLFGLGLAFYATPSTDAALSSLPDEQAGAGSGVYKMASSLGAAFGAAIPTSIYVAMSTSDSTMLGNVIEFTVRQDNAVVREAGMFGMFAVLIMALIALSSIILFVPNDAGSKKSDKAPTKATELMLEAKRKLHVWKHRSRKLRPASRVLAKSTLRRRQLQKRKDYQPHKRFAPAQFVRFALKRNSAPHLDGEGRCFRRQARPRNLGLGDGASSCFNLFHCRLGELGCGDVELNA